jgi:hypothetical protein
LVEVFFRARYKLHAGEEEAFLTELAKGGIDLKILQRDMGGTNDFDYAHWVHDRREANI